MITGMVPEDAMERWISDKITNLQDIFGTGLAPEQSKAIMKGLAVKKEDRYQDVVQLAEVLYDEHVMRQNLWFRTEELPHQMLSGGHTQTVRREAAVFLKKSDPKKKMVWRVAAGAVIFAAVVVLWIYLGGPGSRGQKKGLQPEKAAVSVTMQPAGTDGVTSSVQPDEAGDTTSSPSGKEDNTTSTSRSDEPASAKPQSSDGAGKSDGKNSATTNNTGSRAASNKTPARHAGADRQSSTKTGTGIRRQSPRNHRRELFLPNRQRSRQQRKSHRPVPGKTATPVGILREIWMIFTVNNMTKNKPNKTTL